MDNRTEREKMLTGILHKPQDPELTADRLKAKKFCRLYNEIPVEDEDSRIYLLKEHLGRVMSSVKIEPPFYCDYGYNIYLGENVYMNHGCIFLDSNSITLGNDTMLGPYVQIITVSHPLNSKERLKGEEIGSKIKIGAGVWIGAGAIILPGVSIGDNTVIGAGSVVTKDIPANVIAVGNPCKILRKIEDNF